MSGIDAVKDIISANDSDPLRVEEICHNIERAVRFYIDKHVEGVNKRSQSLITKFVRTPEPAQQFKTPANPSTSTSGLDDDDSISETDFEGFMTEVAAIAQDQDVASSDSESDNEGPGPQ